jgi:hypothetical protein
VILTVLLGGLGFFFDSLFFCASRTHRAGGRVGQGDCPTGKPKTRANTYEDHTARATYRQELEPEHARITKVRNEHNTQQETCKSPQRATREATPAGHTHREGPPTTQREGPPTTQRGGTSLQRAAKRATPAGQHPKRGTNPTHPKRESCAGASCALRRRAAPSLSKQKNTHTHMHTCRFFHIPLCTDASRRLRVVCTNAGLTHALPRDSWVDAHCLR